jgi:hypothetical protein
MPYLKGKKKIRDSRNITISFRVLYVPALANHSMSSKIDAFFMIFIPSSGAWKSVIKIGCFVRYNENL